MTMNRLHILTFLFGASLVTACVEPPTSTPRVDDEEDASMQASDMASDLPEKVDLPAVNRDMPTSPDQELVEPDMSSACNPGCDDTKLCDEAIGECVTCLPEPDNDQDYARGCSDDTPLCDGGLCMPCGDDTPLYVAEIGSCVECLDDSTCTDPERSFCANGSCERCDAVSGGEASCEKFAENPVTNAASVCVAEKGCVECGSSDDCGGTRPLCIDNACAPCMQDSACPDNKVCNPETSLCTEVSFQTTSVGLPCEYDDQCESGAACIAISFGAGPGKEELGTYCMFERDDAEGCPEPPWSYPKRVASQNGGERLFCVHDEDVTSPEAILELGNDCSNAMPCEAKGSQCEVVVGTMPICTYECSSNSAARCPDNDCSGVGFCEAAD